MPELNRGEQLKRLALEAVQSSRIRLENYTRRGLSHQAYIGELTYQASCLADYLPIGPITEKEIGDLYFEVARLVQKEIEEIPHD